MIIETSNISMSSSYSYSKCEEFRRESLTLKSDKAATIELSDKSRSLADQLKSVKEQIVEEEKQKALKDASEKKENQKKNLQQMLEQSKEAAKTATSNIPNLDDGGEIQMLKRILELLRKIRLGKDNINNVLNEVEKNNKEDSVFNIFKDIKAPDLSGITKALANISPTSVDLGNGSHVVNATKWKKITVQSSFFAETESTAYQADGIVRTKDGRELNINLTVEMSRSFEQRYESYLESEFTVVDPLVINLDDAPANLTDKKFLFDLDADGKEEEIAELKQGSGYLCLDKNGDGRINDGSELFGTKSGDGFKDLAKYDSDGNGWIDEKDPIFKDLKVWTKDENGKDKLIDLKKADVGAIFLGSRDTKFSLKDDNNATKGVVRKTGLFLHEKSGMAGSVQHLDVAV